MTTNEPTPVAEPVGDRLVWIDCEMTGLDPARDLLLEIAVVVTDRNLAEIAHFSEVIFQSRQHAVSMMDEVVQRMHTDSGLLDELAEVSQDSCGAAVERRVIEFLAEYDALGAPAAGNNIPFDRAFLDVWMPSLNRDALHYRCIDVSTVKELARSFAPEVFASRPAASARHRALSDIRESIAELAHYRDAGFLAAAEGLE